MDKLSFAEFIYKHPTWKGENYAAACGDAFWMGKVNHQLWKDYNKFLESGKTLKAFFYGHITGE